MTETSLETPPAFLVRGRLSTATAPCTASGQRINMDKSLVHFAKRCGQEVRQTITNVLDVHNLSLKYNHSELVISLISWCDVGISFYY